jgi:hypothetical protein
MRIRLATGTIVMLAAAVAVANPRPLPYTYPSETLPERGLELEQFADLTPVRAFDTSGTMTWLTHSILTTEIEYGISDRLELGLYFQFSDDPGASAGDAPLHFDGIKQRLRYRLADAEEWPVDVSLYGEIAELRNELETEAKVNLQRRFGPVRVMANLWAEREFYFSGRQEWVLNPTVGATYEVSPKLSLGLEYWMHAEFPDGVATTNFNTLAHHYVGPAVMFQFRRLWWSVAPYVRLDGFGREAQLGDQFGRVWVRSVIGIDL